MEEAKACAFGRRKLSKNGNSHGRGTHCGPRQEERELLQTYVRVGAQPGPVFGLLESTETQQNYLPPELRQRFVSARMAGAYDGCGGQAER